MNFSTQKTLVAIMLLICSVILILLVLSATKLKDANKDHDLVVHTHEVIEQINIILNKSIDDESAVRGYLITGFSKFTSLHANTKASIKAPLQKLEILINDNPAQQVNIKQLKKNISDKFLFNDSLMALRETKGLNVASAFAINNSENLFLDKIKKVAGDMNTTEQNLLTRRKMQGNESRHIINVSLYVVLLQLRYCWCCCGGPEWT
jgi:CHASE3 domain sensor protein